MRPSEGWSLSAGRAFLALSSIIQLTSGAVIGSSSGRSSSVSTFSPSTSSRASSGQNKSSIDPSSSSPSSSAPKQTNSAVIISSGVSSYGVGSSASNVIPTSSSKPLISTGSVAQNTDSLVSSTVPASSQPTSAPPSTSTTIPVRSTGSSSISSSIQGPFFSSTTQPSSIRISSLTSSVPGSSLSSADQASSIGSPGSSNQSTSNIVYSFSGASPTASPSTSLGVLSTPPSGSGSSKSLAPSSANSDSPSIVSSTIVKSGSTVAVSVITGGSDSTPITLPPVTSTIQSSEATSSVSSVSSDIAGLIPIINSWKNNPDYLKTETLDKVKAIRGEVEGLISDLGGSSSSSGCNSKKKRGLFGSIGNIITSLTCIDEDLGKVTDDINTKNIDSIDDTLDELTENNDNLTENDNEDNSERSSNSDSSTTTSSSSCTDLSTAFKVTVKCVPTSFVTGSSTLPTTTCTPSTTVTTAGCSVTGLTTTISTSASATGTQIPCASDTCGKSCPMNKGPLSGASMGVVATTENCALISTSTTATLPTGSYGIAGSIGVTAPTQSSSASKRSQSSSHENHLVDRSLVERALADVSPPYADYVRSLTPVWVSQSGDASGQWFDFPTFGHSAAGVNGIYGCTAVIIASEKGVYISHIWESPVFIHGDFSPTDDSYFVSTAFNSLRDGTASAQSVTDLIGSDQSPGVLNAIYAPKVFVLTPYTTDFDRQMFGISTRLRYQDRANDLAQRLANVIPGSGGQGIVMGYTRTSQQASTQEPGVAGRAILEVDPFQTWLTTPNDPGSAGLQVGRWRLWVEDQLITYQDFWLPHAAAPAGSFQKRDGGYANPCSSYTNSSSSSSSSYGISTSLASSATTFRSSISTSHPSSSERSSSSSAFPSATSSAPGNVSSGIASSSPSGSSSMPSSEASSPPTLKSSSTSSSSSAPSSSGLSFSHGSSSSMPVSSTGPASSAAPASSSGITSAPITSTLSPSSTSTSQSSYVCFNQGGPMVATPYCQCTTTSDGEGYYATAPLISDHCTDYTTFPSSITPKSTVTQAPTTATPEPIVKTEDGNIVSYPSRTLEYGEVYGKQYTFTNGAGSPVTLETAAPTQTDVNNKGSSQCSSVDDACQRAYEQFEDDTVYSGFASYTAKIQSGMVMVATFGQAGCVAQYKCDDYGFGMTGRQIKDAIEYMKDNDGVKKCGTTYLSNSCHVTLNYCTSCKSQH
ncbi:hypothetical protein PENANT_c038G10160 [Penicillium antarcticum]|uniref:Uncharacterized protein n=1 Tax=Penicillium antarcticum TaxID=416450 RepID=A0A1V6PU02_9EURO|nr:hypothetical protein PENANT_c038G10160 [Penicillium antarcticum]